MSEPSFSHLTPSGKAHMVDVGDKAGTDRLAIARGEVILSGSTLDMIERSLAKKGDVLTVAQIAGIMGAKRTAELIPLCHPLPIQQVELNLAVRRDLPGIEITAAVRTHSKTGVEMEALTGVAVAALTVYDMVKAVERSARIQNIRLVEKHGGKSGDFYNE